LLAQAADRSGATLELEEAHAQLVRKEVELDQALQDKESAVRELDHSAEATRLELKAVAQQRDELRSSQASLQAQLAVLSSTETDHSSQLNTFQKRIEDTEREKRDLVVVVDRLRSDGAQAQGMAPLVSWHFLIVRNRGNSNTAGQFEEGPNRNLRISV
jgi:nucleoprotein TPR